MIGWENFLLAQVGASAALAGLIFVGGSINLTKILSLPALPARAFEAFLNNSKSMPRAKAQSRKMIQKQSPCALAVWRETIFQMSQFYPAVSEDSIGLSRLSFFHLSWQFLTLGYYLSRLTDRLVLKDLHKRQTEKRGQIDNSSQRTAGLTQNVRQPHSACHCFS